MTIQIVVPGAAFTKPVARLGLPYRDLADHYFLFGTDAATSVKNLAPNAPTANGVAVPGQIVGAPAFGSNYGRFGGVDFFKAGTGTAGPATFLVAFRKVGAERGLFGNWDSATGLGLLAYMQSGVEFWGGPNGTTDAHLAFAPGDDFHLAAITFDGQTTRLYAFAGGAPLFGAEAKAGVLASAAFRIGGWPALGAVDAAMAMAFPIALTQKQLVEIHDYAKVLLRTRGVTLV